jgi:hypothetical protein
MRSVEQILDELLADEDTDSEIGRLRAYRRCVLYAEDNLAAHLQCNLFLNAAAERLGQPPVALPIIHNRVLPEGDARLCFYYHDDDGPVMVGNREGLAYLGKLLTELAQAPPPENVVLPEDFEIFVADSYGLVAYHETPDWFAAAEEGQEDELVAGWEEELQSRILTSEEVAGVQFQGHLSASLCLSLQKIYAVHEMREWQPTASNQVVRKPFRRETDRVRVLDLIDDDGEPLALGVDLDDPDITFYYDWHLEQLRDA